ncbi:hypothetical protein I79_002453 [Cricetulus griseus]|uniref:Uncharacterized protein n=1 Tax=Cricetulus griseus TaxID=10029 RepID=G3GXG3_CRIGR|nr:hypothetical protein I79_002453 [Cricetulus griseus]
MLIYTNSSLSLCAGKDLYTIISCVCIGPIEYSQEKKHKRATDLQKGIYLKFN